MYSVPKKTLSVSHYLRSEGTEPASMCSRLKQSVAESCQGVAAAKIISELRCPTGYTGAEFQHQ